jgi:hypothetical protein
MVANVKKAKDEAEDVVDPIHYSYEEDGEIPETFACGEKPRHATHWTAYPWIVTCRKCKQEVYG